MKYSIVYTFTNNVRKQPYCRKDGTISGSHTLSLSFTNITTHYQNRPWKYLSLPPRESCTSNPSALFAGMLALQILLFLSMICVQL
ncbi:hypothetical protein LINPERHAP1_LOCUS5338 [Linum perenne]